jgi:hypothetical protein
VGAVVVFAGIVSAIVAMSTGNGTKRDTASVRASRLRPKPVPSVVDSFDDGGKSGSLGPAWQPSMATTHSDVPTGREPVGIWAARSGAARVVKFEPAQRSIAVVTLTGGDVRPAWP